MSIEERLRKPNLFSIKESVCNDDAVAADWLGLFKSGLDAVLTATG